MTLELTPIPCLTDNYAWLWHDTATDTVVVVDVPEAAPVLKVLSDRRWQLHHILITHHHADHVAGVEALALATGAKVAGAAADAHRLPPLDHPVAPGDMLPLGMETAQVLAADGHTLGHIAWYLPGAGLLFSGDSLMSWGCGRLFEGTPAQMFDTLTRLAALPPETRVCSGHEYTEANGRFALSLEPGNARLQARMDRVTALRQAGAPSLPVTLAERGAQRSVIGAQKGIRRPFLGLPGDAAPLAVFTAARAHKDRF